MAFSLVGEKGASDIFKGINSVPNRTSASNLMCSSAVDVNRKMFEP